MAGHPILTAAALAGAVLIAIGVVLGAAIQRRVRDLRQAEDQGEI